MKLAQNPFFGNMEAPIGVNQFAPLESGGMIVFFSNIFKLLITIAGLFAFFNFIMAGYSFLSAGGNPKNIEGAWAKIWQSLLGLIFVAGSFVLAAIIGWIVFHDYRAIISPKIYTP